MVTNYTASFHGTPYSVDKPRVLPARLFLVLMTMVEVECF